MSDVPEDVLNLPLWFTPTHFSLPVAGLEYADVLVAVLNEQPSIAPAPDDIGNMQAGVRIDLIDNTYWISAREGTTQVDIDAAVSQYNVKKAEMYPDA